MAAPHSPVHHTWMTNCHCMPTKSTALSGLLVPISKPIWNRAGYFNKYESSTIRTTRLYRQSVAEQKANCRLTSPARQNINGLLYIGSIWDVSPFRYRVAPLGAMCNGLFKEKLGINLESYEPDNSRRPTSNILSFPAEDKPKEPNCSCNASKVP